jgi:peptidoglycan/xylan/chitin deacetylase (PgdA/CDA1 family)
MIEYKEIKPKLSLDRIYDKYIIKGNTNKYEVSFVFKLSDTKYLINVLNFLSKKNIKASFLSMGKRLKKKHNISYRIADEKHEIYNLGMMVNMKKIISLD